LNLGNVTRVTFQIATDFSPTAYRIMGISGFIEVVALSLWGYELFANMRTGRELENDSSWRKSFGQTVEIAPKTKVGDVLACYPQSLDVFVRRGFTLLRNPVLRKTMARAITIEQACRRENVDINELLNELRQTVSDTNRSSAPLVSITRIDQGRTV
jgi:hypothetical protein